MLCGGEKIIHKQITEETRMFKNVLTCSSALELIPNEELIFVLRV
jgi:hypothetical protein